MTEPFPDANYYEEPQGIQVIVQFRKPELVTKGGIIKTDSTMEDQQYFTDTALVLGISDMAFKYRDTGKPWPGTKWAKVGDIVRVSPYSGHQFFINADTTVEQEKKGAPPKVKFGLLNDNHLLSVVQRGK